MGFQRLGLREMRVWVLIYFNRLYCQAVSRSPHNSQTRAPTQIRMPGTFSITSPEARYPPHLASSQQRNSVDQDFLVYFRLGSFSRSLFSYLDISNRDCWLSAQIRCQIQSLCLSLTLGHQPFHSSLAIGCRCRADLCHPLRSFRAPALL